MDYSGNLEENPRKLLLWFGYTFIAAGSVALVYLAILSYQIINNPSEVELVKWLLASTQNSDYMLKGSINHNSFQFETSDVMLFLFLGIIGLTLVRILISIVSALISAGIKLAIFGQQGAEVPNKR